MQYAMTKPLSPGAYILLEGPRHNVHASRWSQCTEASSDGEPGYYLTQRNQFYDLVSSAELDPCIAITVLEPFQLVEIHGALAVFPIN